MIVPAAAYAAWLNPAEDGAAMLATLLATEEGAGLEAYAVSRRVNSPRNEGAALTEPAAGTGTAG